MAKKIFETHKTPMTPAKWLTSNLDMHGMTNIELARRLDVVSTLICAWKKGAQKIPLAYCEPLSNIFGTDALYLRNLMLNSYFPGLWERDEKIRTLGSITESEYEFIKILRENAVANVQMTDEEKEEFKKFVAKLRDSRGLRADSPEQIIADVGPGGHKNIYYATEKERQKAEKWSEYRAERGDTKKKKSNPS